jgi:hypothetical protein
MGKIDIVIFIIIKVDGVLGVGYKYRPADFTFMSRRVLGSDVARMKNQLVYICNKRIRLHLF